MTISEVICIQILNEDQRIGLPDVLCHCSYRQVAQDLDPKCQL